VCVCARVRVCMCVRAYVFVYVCTCLCGCMWRPEVDFRSRPLLLFYLPCGGVCQSNPVHPASVGLPSRLAPGVVYRQCAGEGVWLLTACFPSRAAVSLPCFSHCSYVIEMLKSLPIDEVHRNRQARSIWFLDALIRFRAQKVIKGKSKARWHFLTQLFPAADSSAILTSPPWMSVLALRAARLSSCSCLLPA
jgi:hypothetical protein